MTTINQLIRQASELEASRKALSKSLREVEKELSGVKQQVLSYLLDNEQSIIAHGNARVELGQKEVMVIKNWSTFYKFQHKMYSQMMKEDESLAVAAGNMTQKRVSETIVRDFINMGNVQPEDVGVQTLTVNYVKIK